jgi:hypothetical protein
MHRSGLAAREVIWHPEVVERIGAHSSLRDEPPHDYPN